MCSSLCISFPFSISQSLSHFLSLSLSLSLSLLTTCFRNISVIIRLAPKKNQYLDVFICSTSTTSNGICTCIYCGGLPLLTCFSFIKWPTTETALTILSLLIVTQICGYGYLSNNILHCIWKPAIQNSCTKEDS